MEKFMLMENVYIEKVDEQAIEKRERPRDLKNKLKRNGFIAPSRRDRRVYNAKHIFPILKIWHNLYQAYVHSTLTATGDTVAKTMLGSRIFKRIYLQTKQGILLQEIRPLYTLQRIEETDNTDKQNRFQNMIDPDAAAFNNNTVTLVIPLFFFFSEENGHLLPTRNLEELEIVCITQDNYTAMGLEADITDCSFELEVDYFDTPEKNGIVKGTGFEIYYKNPNMPTILEGTYDIFYEEVVTIPSGSTKARILIENQNPTYVTFMCLQNPLDPSDTHQIKKYTFNMAGTDVVYRKDYRTNFSFNKKGFSGQDSSILSHWWCEEENRNCSTGLMDFVTSFNPTYLEIEFDELVGDYELIVFHEYKTHILVGKDGRLERQLVGSVPSLF